MTDTLSPTLYFSDRSDPDAPGVAPGVIVPIVIGNFANDITHTPDWRIDRPGGSRVTLSAISTSDNEARIGFASGATEGEIRLVREASGGLGVEVTIKGAEVFRARLNQTHEEYELWPAGVEKPSEAPGRMGKRRNWLRLSTDAWPALKPLANGGHWLNLHALDYTTIHVRLLNAGEDAWRLAEAVPVGDGFELLAPEGGDPDTARWEFPPGSIVRCEMRRLYGEDAAVALALVKPGSD